MKKPVAVLVLIALLAPLSGARAEGGKEKGQLPYDHRSPIVAGMLSVVPGGGQVYNQQYVMGGLYFGASAGLYLSAFAYAGVFDPDAKFEIRYESIFLLALAGGIHLLSIFDATMEATRINETLERWSLNVHPDEGAFSLAYRMRF
jgi:hypothetical protein